MTDIQHIYETIECNGFADSTLHLIDNYINDIQNGRTDFPRFTQPEHAGLCASGGEGIRPNRWQIDSLQEQLIEQWAKAAQLWVEDSEQIIVRNYGPMIAQGAEAKVYYREGDTSVVKERASIYSTTQKALDAIALHNFLFPETAMHVVGFTRDTDGILRVILTQPYIRCLRLASKEEIDKMVMQKGFRDNGDGNGVNYISERLALEDMHPANVFIDEVGESVTCIDCIVKFV